MANLVDIQEEVVRIIQDKSYTSRLLRDKINQAVTDICAGVPVVGPEGDQTFSSPMPSLYTIGTVTTSTSLAYVSLPSNYQREVAFVASSGGYEITLYNHFQTLVRSFPLLDMSGSVVACAVKGDTLYYQGIPSTAATLTVHYHAAPTDMDADADEPEGIPARFHRTLIVYKVCLEIFKEKYEEDMEQHQVIPSYEQKIMTELISLESSIAVNKGSVIFKSR